MRQIIARQIPLDGMAIESLDFALESRDEIPQLLRGLQHIQQTRAVRDEVVKILSEALPAGVDWENGRPGMDLWTILVLGTLKVNCGWDYDKVREIANEHRTVRLMLGWGRWDERRLGLQTINDNVKSMTPEILDRINQVVVRAGHTVCLQGKEAKEVVVAGRCDSFVVETDVEFPTDYHLLFGAVEKRLRLVVALAGVVGERGWRQWQHLLAGIKELCHGVRRAVARGKRAGAKAEAGAKVKAAYRAYVGEVGKLLHRAQGTLAAAEKAERMKANGRQKVEELKAVCGQLETLLGQIERRVFKGETIPHEEKIFSRYEPHTEWISKGKAGVPQELGWRVAIVEDQFEFILQARVMIKETDADVAVTMVGETQARFPGLKKCSFDKGFSSAENRQALEGKLEVVILPKKGKWSVADRERESHPDFVAGRKQHPAIESAINALENHGLDRCRDHGEAGFKRYVALAVVGRNLQVLGAKLQAREKAQRERAEARRRRLAEAIAA
jgi:hypothetical protein